MKEIIGEKIRLEFALKKDMRKIYDMMVSDEVGQFMFNEDYPAPRWDQFFEGSRAYFPEELSKDGSYMLIYLENKVAGAISYTCGFEKTPYAEFTVWLAGYEFMGKKIGCEAINLLMDCLNEQFNINHFIIRPWTGNLSAIQSYNRCGFHESAGFDIGKYYSDSTLLKNAKGPYGPRGTVNLHCDYSMKFIDVK